MASILYAWELGAGFGHVARARAVASIVRARGDEVTFALRDLRRAWFLGPENDTIVQAPLLMDTGSRRTAINYSDMLSLCGYMDSGYVRSLVQSWTYLIEKGQIDLVILDHAPSAAIAAHILQVPFLAIGNGFEVPPNEEPFPSLTPWSPVSIEKRRSIDSQILRVVNNLIQYGGGQKLTHLSRLFRPETSLITTAKVLDHYGLRRNDWTYVSDFRHERVGDKLKWTSRENSRRVFVYLSGSSANLENWLRALSRRYDVLAYLRDAPTGLEKRMSNTNIKIAKTPVDLDWACELADAVVCHGGVGTVSACLRHACPPVIAPQHLEQTLVGYRISEAGIGRFLSQRAGGDQLLQVVGDCMTNCELHERLRSAKARSGNYETSRTVVEQKLRNVSQAAK